MNIYVFTSTTTTTKSKQALKIGFYLRALRLCSPQHLDKKFKYIEHSLKNLKLAIFFILNTRKKALNIHSSNKLRKNNNTIPINHRPISLPISTHNKPIYDKLTKLGILIIQTTSQTIKNLTNIPNQTNNATTSHTGIYSIPSKDCYDHDISKTQCNLEKRIYQHK